MTAQLLELKRSAPCEDVVAMLRKTADSIEAGEIDFPVTTAVLVLGHTDSERPEGGQLLQESFWQTFGFGPRTDSFTVRGLLNTVLTQWGHDHD